MDSAVCLPYRLLRTFDFCACTLLRKVLVRIMAWCGERPALAKFAALFLITYVFLLRLPSEALTLIIGPKGLHVIEDQLVLILPRRCVYSSMLALFSCIISVFRFRKNKPRGSRLVRSCWCNQCKVVCMLVPVVTMF